jgi:hypothetical protein
MSFAIAASPPTRQMQLRAVALAANGLQIGNARPPLAQTLLLKKLDFGTSR